MRKITEESVLHFMQSKKYKKGNTEVKVLPNVTVLVLFGNEIAYLYNDPERTLSITSQGYMTNTTKERLNGIDRVHIKQVKRVWYLNGKQWNGKLIDIK